MRRRLFGNTSGKDTSLADKFLISNGKRFYRENTKARKRNGLGENGKEFFLTGLTEFLFSEFSVFSGLRLPRGFPSETAQ